MLGRRRRPRPGTAGAERPQMPREKPRPSARVGSSPASNGSAQLRRVVGSTSQRQRALRYGSLQTAWHHRSNRHPPSVGPRMSTSRPGGVVDVDDRLVVVVRAERHVGVVRNVGRVRLGPAVRLRSQGDVPRLFGDDERGAGASQRRGDVHPTGIDVSSARRHERHVPPLRRRHQWKSVAIVQLDELPTFARPWDELDRRGRISDEREGADHGRRIGRRASRQRRERQQRDASTPGDTSALPCFSQPAGPGEPAVHARLGQVRQRLDDRPNDLPGRDQPRMKRTRRRAAPIARRKNRFFGLEP